MKRGDMVRMRPLEHWQTGKMITGVFLSCRTTKWGDEYLFITLLTEGGIEEHITKDDWGVEVISSRKT